jgi:hypothetical protein
VAEFARDANEKCGKERFTFLTTSPASEPGPRISRGATASGRRRLSKERAIAEMKNDTLFADRRSGLLEHSACANFIGVIRSSFEHASFVPRLHHLRKSHGKTRWFSCRLPTMSRLVDLLFEQRPGRHAADLRDAVQRTAAEGDINFLDRLTCRASACPQCRLAKRGWTGSSRAWRCARKARWSALHGAQSVR